MVVEISLTKNLERKKKEQIHVQGRTNSRMPICNPTIQLVIANLYTKFEVSILTGCRDIFDKNSGETEKRTNIGKNKQEKAHFQHNDTTCRCEPVY